MNTKYLPLFVCLLLFLPHNTPAAPGNSAELDRILQLLKFEPSQKGALLQGEILSNDPTESTEKELAVTIAIFMPGPLPKVVGLVREAKVFEINQDILQYGRISNPPSPADFASLKYERLELSDLSDLLEVKPGSDFNLSEKEIERFASLRRTYGRKDPQSDAAVAEAVLNAYRAVLLERCQAYAKAGLKGIAPYQRGKNKFANPDQELAKAIQSDFIQTTRAKDFLKSFRDFPAGAAEGIDSQFFWVKQRVQDRPCLILIHNLIEEKPTHAYFAQRQFFVGHSYNTLQILVGSQPVEGGVVVFYRNRTSTDQVAGLGSGLRHKIGRDMMRKEIINRFQQIRSVLEKK